MSNLDLASHEQTIQAGASGRIQVGEAVRDVAPHDLLTAAESVALQQAINGGQQITLNGSGEAIGGTVTIDHTLNPTETMVIPAGVTIIQSMASLSLTGNLTNNGIFYAVPNGGSASISANNIFNNAGATISTVLPAELGLGNGVPINLTLSAVTDIINAGSILSSANLTLNAGGNIVNALPAGFIGPEPIMQAVSNIAMNPGLQSQLGTVVNQGIIQSIGGNIDVANLIHNNLLINNVQGELIARAGTVNIGDILFTGKVDTRLWGGDVYTTALNIASGSGNTLVDVHELIGIVNITSGGAHVYANTDSLQLGLMQLNGDPLYYNLGGDITINNAISTNGTAPLSIVAFGNVLSSNTGSITTSGTNGSSLFIMAGANFTVTTPPDTSQSNTGSVDVNQGTEITVTALNATGNIDLSNLVADITTNGTTQPGGNVMMVAPGRINLGSHNINTSGFVGANGTVVLIAGGAGGGTAITGTGDITTRTPAGGTATGGDIVLAASTAVIPSSFTIDQSGLINGGPGTTITTGTTFDNASISIGNLSTGAASVVVVSGSTVTVGNVETQSSAGALSGGPVSLVGASVDVGTINTVGTGGGSNGTVSVIATGTSGTTITTGAITTNGNSGASGDVLLITSSLASTPTYTITGGNLVGFQSLTTDAVQNASISASTITTNAAHVAVIAGQSISNLGSITSSATNLTAPAGGNVLLLAGQSIIQALASQISTVGLSGSTNGNVLVAAGGGGTIGSINTQGPGSSGGSVILLVATPTSTAFTTGAQITTQGGADVASAAIQSANLIAGNISTNGNSVIGVSGGDLTVGTVDLTTSGTLGGSVLLVGGGSVTAGGATTKGTTAKNGDVYIISGAALGPAVTVSGAIDTAGPVPDDGGKVILVAATPNTSNFSLTNSAVTAGSTITANNMLGGTIAVSAVTTNSSPITIAGGNVVLSGTLKTNGTVSSSLVGAGGPVAVFASSSIGSGSALSGINTSGAASNYGGDVLLMAGVLISPLTLSVDATSYTSDFSLTIAGAGSGGSIDLTGGGVGNMSTFTTAGGTATASNGFTGGNVQIIAFPGATGGSIKLPSALTITTGGTTPPSPFVSFDFANQSGYVNILAGAQSGTAISLGGVNTTGSQAGGGSITITTASPEASQFPLPYFTANVLGTVPMFVAGATQAGDIVLNGSLQAQGGNRYTTQAYLIYTSAINVTAGGDMLLNASITNPNNTLPSSFSPYAVSTGTPPAWPPLTFVRLNSSTINLSAGGAMTFAGSPTISSDATPTVQQNSSDPYVGSTGTSGGTITISALNYSGAATISADGTGGRYLPPVASPIPAPPPPAPAPVPAWPPSPTPATYFPLEVPNGGDGGTISITSSGAGSPVAVSGTGFTISAIGDAPNTVFGKYNGGGNGGIVTMSSAGALTIESPSFTVGPQAGANTLPTLNTQGWPNEPLNNQVQIPTGSGAIVTLTGTTVFIDGAFNVDGAASTLTASGGYPGGNGGSLYINVNSSTAFNLGGATAITGNGTTGLLSASGNIVDSATVGAIAAFGSGGTISITNTGGGITIGSGMLAVSAADATETAGAIPAQGPTAPTPGFSAGAGGQIVLNGTTVLANSSLNANGGASSTQHTSGSGGSVYVTVNAPGFVIGTPTANGVTGAITANGNVVGPAATGLAPSNLLPTGGGGTVSITNLNGGIAIDLTGVLSALASNANSTLGSNGGAGGTISLTATGPVTSAIALAVNGGAASSGTAPDSGFGGQLTIVSNSGAGAFAIGGGGATSLQAIGYSGGSISVQENGTGGITVAAGSLLVTANSNSNATSTGGNGGSISLTASNGPLVINGGFDVSGASGSNLAGNAGNITLVSNSATAFLIDSTSGPGANGVGGTLSANGGTGTAGNGDAGQIFISNLGGGITVTAADVSVNAPNATVGAYAGNGGTITLCVGSSMLDPAGCGCAAPATSVIGAVTITGALDASGGTAFLGAYSAGLGGTINILENTSTTLQIGAPGTLTGLTANGWSGGTISVKNLGGSINVATGAIQVQAGAADPTIPQATYLNYGVRPLGGPGGTICIQCPNGTLTYGNLDASGGALFQQTASTALTSGTSTITVGSVQGFVAGQQIVVSNGPTSEIVTIQSIAGNTLTLASGVVNNYATAPTVSAYSVQTTANTVSIQPGTGSGATFNYLNSDQLVLSVNNAQGFIFLQPVVISDGTNSEIQFVTGVNTATNTINVTGAATQFNASSTNLSVNAFSNNGTINLNGGTGIAQQSTLPGATNILRGNTITLSSSSGNAGTSTNPLQVEVMANSTAGTLSVQAQTSFVNNISNTLSLGTITTAGGFNLTSNGTITATAPITTGGALTLINTNTTFGNIGINSQLTAGTQLTLQNNNLLGLINIGTGAGLTASDLLLTNGPAPATPVLGTAPGNVTVVSNAPFSVFFGNNAITSIDPLTIFAITGNVIFNASSPGLISFGTGSTIGASVPKPFNPAPPSLIPPTQVLIPPTTSSAPTLLPTASLVLPSFRTDGTIIPTDKTPGAIPNESAYLGGSQRTSQFTQQPFLIGKITVLGDSVDTSVQQLPSGNSLLLANSDVRISTPFGDVMVKAGSAVMFFLSDVAVAILNLHDENFDAVSFDSGGQAIGIPLGRQLVATSSADMQFDDLNPSQIGYRELSQAVIGRNRLFFTEFSIVSALRTVIPSLKASNPDAESIIRRILKSAAANLLLRQRNTKSAYKASR